MEIFLRCAIAVFAFQCLLFVIALLKKNNGIADIGWGLGFIIISVIAYFFRADTPDPDWTSQDLILFFVLAWGLRLSIYLLIRNWNKPEDWRYAAWRQDWGRSFFIRSFLQVFILQGFFMMVIGSPIMLAFLSPYEIQVHQHILLAEIAMSMGIIFWLIGFFFQAVGDAQLFRFKKDPANKGRVMRYGVWRYTRHPNYFGEATMWWGIFLISCVSAHGVLDVVLRMIGPATITFMLLRVSGVTMLENKYKGNKEYEDYQTNTSSFIPMLPKIKGQ